MTCQLVVLWDLRPVFLGNNSWYPWFTGQAALPTFSAVLATLTWAAALWWRTSSRATLAGGAACLLSWCYYVVSLGMSYFAAELHPLLYLLPLFPLLVATGVVLKDGFVEARQPVGRRLRNAGFRVDSPPELTAELTRATGRALVRLQDNSLFVPAVYAITSPILLLHPDWYRWDQDIWKALHQTWNLSWPDNFAWLPQLAVLTLVSAAITRKVRPTFSAKLGLCGGVLGCAYGVWSLEALSAYLENEKRYPSLRTTALQPDSMYLVRLSVSLVPLLLTAILAVRDVKKTESGSAILLRSAATLCFAAFVLSVGLHVYGISSASEKVVLLFGTAYLLYAFHSASWSDYALGASLGQAILVFCVFGVFTPHRPFAPERWPAPIMNAYQQRDALLLQAIVSSNILLVLGVATSAMRQGKSYKTLPALAGVGAALLFGVLIFAGIMLSW